MTESLPPSCQAVRLALKHAGPLTWSDLKRRTQLADSSLNRALDRLEREDVAALVPHYETPDEYDLLDSQRP